MNSPETTREVCAADLWAMDTGRMREDWRLQPESVQKRYLTRADHAGRLATTHIAWVLETSHQMPGVRLPWTVPQLAALIYRYVKPPGSPSRYRNLPPDLRKRYERAALQVLAPQIRQDAKLIEQMFAPWYSPGVPPPPPVAPEAPPPPSP